MAFVGTALLALGVVSFATAGGASAGVPGDAIPLHNDTAEPETDCPAGGGAYWHFVFAPNDGSASFTSIVLVLDGDTVVFDGAEIIPNGSQTDNVFVAVPSGYTLTSLEKDGSYATYSGEEPNLFNLSHVCTGSTTTTTSTSVAPTTTEAPTTTTTEASTTTESSVAGVTTIAGGGGQPGAQQQAEVRGATQAAPVSSLPYTGSEDTALIVAGAAMLAGGTLLALAARRRRTA